jgi:hypothetical protein
MTASSENGPTAVPKLFDEPVREVDDDRLDVYERARDALAELKAALPSATDDIERLLERINAAYWEVCGVPENEATPARPGRRNRNQHSAKPENARGALPSAGGSPLLAGTTWAATGQQADERRAVLSSRRRRVVVVDQRGTAPAHPGGPAQRGRRARTSK